MHYDEHYFKRSSNIKAMMIWLIMGIALSAAYLVEVTKGLNTVTYYIQLMAFCWTPFLIGVLVLKIKGMGVGIYKDIIAFGYGTFYTFILLTTTSPLAFAYLLPLTSMLILYKDRNYMIRCGVASLTVLLISIIVNIKRGHNTPDDIGNYEIQVACLILCFAGYILSINHMQKSDGSMMGSLQENLKKVVHTVETVKIASNDIVDGMSAVRELADENIVGANTVVDGMSNLTKNNSGLRETTASSLNLTETINNQVQSVASMISQMVNLATESADHAKVSAEELSDVVRLSIEVEEVLREFKNQFMTMANEINIIESITMQTNILSLNASIEAARAGEAGKGFAVVAGEIRELSSRTKNSSDSIFTALQHLRETSDKMTESITKTLEKVKQVDQSVEKITVDTTQIGDNIKNIDEAVTEVSTSNTKLVENMHDVSNVVALMTESIVTSEEVAKVMLSKNIETTNNVAEVEKIVGRLMEELGVIGVMGIKDIREGQMATIGTGNREYRVRIDEVLQDGVLVESLQDWNASQNMVCEFVATVDNSYYKWESAEVIPTVKSGKRVYKVVLTTNPSVLNRRKYKRIPMNNPARVTIMGTNHEFHGQMVNISEGGYAFMTNDPGITQVKQETVSLVIDNFASFKEHELDAKVIRVGEQGNGFCIGCRFLYDNVGLRSMLRN